MTCWSAVTSSGEPWATILPSLMQMTESHRRIRSGISWLTITNEVPCSLRSRMRVRISSLALGWTPAKGSSMSTTTGSVTRARTNSSNFCWPPLSSLAGVSRWAARPTKSSRSSAFRSVCARPPRWCRVGTSRFSSAVTVENTRGFWKVRVTPWATTSRLERPLRSWMVPGSTVKATSATAWRPPNRLLSPVTRRLPAAATLPPPTPSGLLAGLKRDPRVARLHVVRPYDLVLVPLVLDQEGAELQRPVRLVLEVADGRLERVVAHVLAQLLLVKGVGAFDGLLHDLEDGQAAGRIGRELRVAEPLLQVSEQVLQARVVLRRPRRRG